MTSESPMKLLIVTRHFPPEVSGGVRRWLLLSQALARRDHEVVVVAPDILPAPDPDIHADNLTVLRVPHPAARRGHNLASQQGPIQPSHIAQGRTAFEELKAWARSHLLIPDPDIRWAQRVRQVLADKYAHEAFDWVITSSPPESLHFLGYALTGKIARYWHADLRDHWLEFTLVEERKRIFRRLRERRLARNWLGEASLITALDHDMENEVKGLASGRVTILPNFTQQQSRQDTTRGEVDFLGDKKSVRLVHTGSFTLSDPHRTIQPVIEAFKAAATEQPNITLHLFGKLAPNEYEHIALSKYSARIFIYGPVSAHAARAAQHQADALILTASPSTPSLPGKLLEYREARKPIIVIGNGPWRQKLSETAIGAEAMIAAGQGLLNFHNVTSPTTEETCALLEALYRPKSLAYI